MIEAPGLFTYDEKNHCFVRRQPSTQGEFDQMFSAAWNAEVQCIRYRGNDPEVLRRFAELGEAGLCDTPPPPTIKPLVRDTVTFENTSSNDTISSAADVAELFVEFLRTLDAKRQGLPDEYKYRIGTVVGDEAIANLTYSWFEPEAHSVEFRNGTSENQWLIHHCSRELRGGRGVSNQLHKWLESSGRFCRIRWYSDDEWREGGAGRDCPQ
jgi:hypothetical protein